MSISWRQSILHQRQQWVASWLQRLLILAVLILTLSLLVVNGWAQTSFSSIVGTVHNPSGAVIAGCTITVIDVGTPPGSAPDVCTDKNGPVWKGRTPASSHPFTTDNFENFYSDPRADRVPGVPLYPAHKTINEWINPAAFAVPPNNIGRMGNSQVGSVVGPGTQPVSLSLFKSVPLYKERANLKIGAQIANALNHPNYLPPALDFGTTNSNTISNMQSADASGPRAMQLSARITW